MTEALLAALKGRLAEVEQGRETISEELGRLEALAAALSEESGHLRALIERHELTAPKSAHAGGTRNSVEAKPVPVPNDRIEPPPSNNLALLVPTVVTGEPPSNRWLVVAAEVLQRAGGPLHYRELHKRMKAMGAPSFGGQNPLATFLAAISREAGRPDSPLMRVGRGEYALATQSEQPVIKGARGKRLSRSGG